MKGVAAEIFIDLFSSVLFISLSSLSPSPPPVPPADPETPPAATSRWPKNTQRQTVYLAFVAPSSFYQRRQKREARGVGRR